MYHFMVNEKKNEKKFGKCLKNEVYVTLETDRNKIEI